MSSTDMALAGREGSVSACACACVYGHRSFCPFVCFCLHLSLGVLPLIEMDGMDG